MHNHKGYWSFSLEFFIVYIEPRFSVFHLFQEVEAVSKKEVSKGREGKEIVTFAKTINEILIESVL